MNYSPIFLKLYLLPHIVKTIKNKKLSTTPFLNNVAYFYVQGFESAIKKNVSLFYCSFDNMYL